MVVCHEITKPYLDFPAAIVVEILSPSTAMKGRNNKFYIYQSQKIPYYIIIDVEKNEIEIYNIKEAGKYHLEKSISAKPYPFLLNTDCFAYVTLDNIWV